MPAKWILWLPSGKKHLRIKIFGEFFFAIYDLIHKICSAKLKLMLPLRKHKNWTQFSKICSEKYSVFGLLNRKNKFSKTTKCNRLHRVPKGWNENLNHEFPPDLLVEKYSFPWPRSSIHSTSSDFRNTYSV